MVFLLNFVGLVQQRRTMTSSVARAPAQGKRVTTAGGDDKDDDGIWNRSILRPYPPPRYVFAVNVRSRILYAHYWCHVRRDGGPTVRVPRLLQYLIARWCIFFCRIMVPVKVQQRGIFL